MKLAPFLLSVMFFAPAWADEENCSAYHDAAIKSNALLSAAPPSSEPAFRMALMNNESLWREAEQRCQMQNKLQKRVENLEITLQVLIDKEKARPKAALR